MSTEATIATWKLKNISATKKIILLALADRAGEGGECWPSLKRIESDTCLNRKTIIQNRQELIEEGLIEYTGEVKGRSKQIHVMRLTYVTERCTSTEIGSGESFTSTEIGTGTSTEIGTLNLKEEPKNKDLKTLVDSSNTTRVKTYSEDERFMAFYSCYPRKEKPRDAWKAFKALKPDDQLLKKIIQDVTRRKETHVTWQNGKQYISLPATYLRSAEYEGDITTQHVTDKEQPTPTFDYGHRVVVIDGIEYLESSKNG